MLRWKARRSHPATTAHTDSGSQPESSQRATSTSTNPPVGCEVLYDGQSVDADIVLVHGLGGHRSETWSKGATYWPKDLLPKTVPNVRIIAYGYDSRVNGLFTHVNQDTIRDHSHNLSQFLLATRHTVAEHSRPIIFVAHSLGGLLVKDTLNYSLLHRNTLPDVYSIFQSTSGIIFLGTPHRGSDMATLGVTITRILELFIRSNNPKILEPLKHDSQVLAGITEGFSVALEEKNDMTIYTFHESLSTPGIGIIVNSQSSHLERAKSTPGSIQADHTNMVKFDSDKDPGYVLVSAAIGRMVEMAQRKCKSLPIWSQLPPTEAAISVSMAQAGLISAMEHPSFPYPADRDMPTIPEQRYCPPPTEIFIGRAHILKQMHNCFIQSIKSQKVFVLHGLGGSGKSQIAFKFVEECEALYRFSSIFFIHANTAESIQTDLQGIALVKNAGRTYEDALAWLARRKENWLMIFDEADDPHLKLRSFFPKCRHGNIIITTRNPIDRYTTQSHCDVSRMDAEDARELLLKVAQLDSAGQNAAKASCFVKELGCLALAIVQVGAYISQSGWTLDHYVDEYHKRHHELLEEYELELDDYQWTVYTTWELSFKQLSDIARQFLIICSYLFHDDITEAIFENAANNITDDFLFDVTDDDNSQKRQQLQQHILGHFMTAGSWDSMNFNRCIQDIRSYSLIHLDGSNNSYSIHPLVHDWIRTRGLSNTFNVSAAQILLGTSISWNFQSKDISFRRRLLPHILFTLQRSAAPVETDIASSFALVLYEAGQWTYAEELLVKAMETTKRVLGEEHPDTLTSIANLASTYWNQGRWTDAEQLQGKVMETTKRVLGEEHPHTLSSITNLAATYWNQGRWTDAEQLEVMVMETRKRVLGEEHPDTLLSIANLASTYRNQGRWKDAEQLEVKVMETTKRVLGEEHPDTLLSIANLASTYRNQGRWMDAEQLEVKVMETTKRVLGEEHPHTLSSIANLAATYWNQGRWTDAEQLEVMVMETRKRVLGEEHPDTLLSIANLASTYRNQGRWKDAEQLEVKVMETTKRVLGEEHPDTLLSIANLASTYRNQGRWMDAEQLEVKVMETTKRVLGEEHPHTLSSIANLAATYWNQGRWTDAEQLEVMVMETRKRVLGEEHPDTLLSIANLASTYRNQGRWKDAEQLEVKVMETRKRVLGEEHPDTLLSIANLASTYRNQGRWTDAEQLEVKVMETTKRVLGEEHPHTLSSIANLAATYWNQGRWTDAEQLEVMVMETRKRVLGEEHPDTLLSIANLASTYRNQGRWKDAEQLEVKVMETTKRVLGEEHPDTLLSIANLASTYRNQGRWTDAEQLEVKVMETTKRVLGEEHPHTLSSITNLAATYWNQGRWTDAGQLQVMVMETRKRVLGEEHPDTLTSITNLASMYRDQGRWTDAEQLEASEAKVMETRKRVLGEEHPDTLTSITNLANSLS